MLLMEESLSKVEMLLMRELAKIREDLLTSNNLSTTMFSIIESSRERTESAERLAKVLNRYKKLT